MAGNAEPTDERGFEIEVADGDIDLNDTVSIGKAGGEAEGHPAPAGDDEHDDGDGGEGGLSPEDKLKASRSAERRLKRQLDKRDRELADLRERMERMEGRASQQDDAAIEHQARTIEAQLADVRNRRKKAMEDGDTDAVDALDENLYKLRRAKEQVDETRARRRQGGDQSDGDRRRQQRDQQDDGEGGDDGVQDLVADWQSRHPWFGRKGSEKDSKLAADLSKAIHAEGIDPSDPEHFEELDRRLREYAPHRFGQGGQDDRDNGGSRRPRQTVGAGGGRMPGGGSGSGNVVPRALLKTYQDAGFDVKDPKVQQRMLQYYNETKGRAR